MSRIPIYFIPGLAANPLIFEKIKLSPIDFDSYYIEWKAPLSNESLDSYIDRIISEIKHKNPILIGVSFGGIIAQEIAKKIIIQRVIIISSVKSHEEFPKIYKLLKISKLYYLPLGTIINFIYAFLKKINTSKKTKKKFELYDRYLTMRSNNYLNWGIKNIILWENIKLDSRIKHIHGTKDEIFPSKNIKNAQFLNKATHTLILTRYKWLNENLPKLILKNNYEK